MDTIQKTYESPQFGVKPCPNCLSKQFFLMQKGPHIGAYCKKCGSYICWVKKNKLIEQEVITNEQHIAQSIDDDELPWL